MAGRGGLAPWQVRRTTEYLRDNLARDVTLSELAAVAKLSPFHFARAFKASLGMPPHVFHRTGAAFGVAERICASSPKCPGRRNALSQAGEAFVPGSAFAQRIE